MELKGARVEVQLPDEQGIVAGRFVRTFDIQVGNIRTIKALVLTDNGRLLETYTNKIKFTMKEDKEMELRDTVAMMESEDYKERFKAEYYQTKIRYNKLHKMTIKYEAGKLDFEPSCPLRLLLEQKRCMGAYLHALEVRAQIEGIDLEEAQA